MLTDYHNYTQLVNELDILVEKFPDLSRIYSLGNTTEYRELIVIQISQGVTEVSRALLSDISLRLLQSKHY